MTRSCGEFIRRGIAVAAVLLWAAALPARQPNVIVILLDDMGWRDVGFAGNRFIDTPNMDRLAKGGAVLAQCYAAAPNCAPSRACLLTGQVAPRHGVYTVVDDRYAPGQPHMRVLSTKGNDELPPATRTLADSLRANGYATALIGMWNLGRGRAGSPGSPTSRGFDIYRKPEDLGFAKDAYQDERKRYLSDALTDEAIAWMDKQKDKPFFLYYADHSVHEPFDPKPELVAKYRARKAAGADAGITPEYAATVEALDADIGRLVAKVEALGLAQDTLILLTSDNGGLPYVVGSLRGSKGLLYEGGLRVPGLVYWPGTVPAGKVIEEPISGIDFAPTILEATHTPAPKDQAVDGVSLLAALRTGAPLPARPLYWHFPCYIGKGEPMSLLRLGDYKLIQKFAGPTFELYNLRLDPGETKDLAKAEPARLEAMRQQLAKWQKETGAFLADQPNPAYDPAAKEPRGPRAGGSRSKK